MPSAPQMQREDPSDSRRAQRVAAFEALTRGVKLEMAEDHFAAAVGQFREAVNVSRSLAELEETAVRLAIELAAELEPRGWRLARSLLVEAAEVDTEALIPPELWKQIEDSEREEAIGSALQSADAMSSKWMIPPVRQRLAMLAAQYPGEARLQTRLRALDEMGARETNGERRLKEEQRLKAAEAKQLRARVAWARAREFQKGGFPEDALEQLQEVRELDPCFPGLADEIKRCSLIEAQEETVSLAPAGPEITGHSAARLNHLLTAATVVFSLASLTAAGGLIWRHQFTSAARPAALRKLEGPEILTQDERAWSAVDPKDLDLVESYLNHFPEGANRGRAIQALSDIRQERRQSAEVRDVLRQYEAAWNARNVDSLLSLQSDLDRRTLEAQLLPLKKMVMNLSPASSARIEGNQATIRCLRTVSEVDETGVEKRSPEQAVTFVLARRDGGWVIRSARP